MWLTSLFWTFYAVNCQPKSGLPACKLRMTSFMYLSFKITGLKNSVQNMKRNKNCKFHSVGCWELFKGNHGFYHQIWVFPLNVPINIWTIRSQLARPVAFPATGHMSWWSSRPPFPAISKTLRNLWLLGFQLPRITGNKKMETTTIGTNNLDKLETTAGKVGDNNFEIGNNHWEQLETSDQDWWPFMMANSPPGAPPRALSAWDKATCRFNHLAIHRSHSQIYSD